MARTRTANLRSREIIGGPPKTVRSNCVNPLDHCNLPSNSLRNVKATPPARKPKASKVTTTHFAVSNRSSTFRKLFPGLNANALIDLTEGAEL